MYSVETQQHAKRLNISPEALQTYLDAGQGKLGQGVSRYMHATVKTVGSACNLDCNYCYYLSKEGLLDQKNQRIGDALLETFVADYIASQDVEEIVFTWHGGEPTLLGVDFFRRIVALQARHTPPGRRISNDLQTNGTLLNDEWGEFLAEAGFLVGLSIDGPRELHDAYRPTKAGKSSFDAVMNGVQVLKKYGVPFSTLTVINRKNALQPLEVYRFLRDELGVSYMQFIPCVEPTQFEQVAPGHVESTQLAPVGSPRSKPGHPLSIVTDWSVDSADWGRFLATVFDEWIVRDLNKVRINLFETTIAQLQGKPAMLCTSSPYCGKNVAVEQDGRVYSCDHYVYPEYEIGKIGERPLSEMVFSLRQLEFGLDKFNSLPGECRRCPHLKLCYGECPRTRLLKTRPGEGNLSYLCEGWKHFYDHAVPVMQRLR
ncbi:uncharacterized protein SAMN02745857_02529 [Andreprevotia lacus DSM 23236]|jgi:uncharacterized protein|uniref:Radical SAM core domain-containing protein n=1 Tax=Andreprevotia lacus DSM 23236 TaxID=1121001 RepID=A0A1W1XRT1_9NEIS|nr:anaerobic sulfatase maturase [Andreprevotia lacus]SMC26565.1 uncharacterized protein SAMN02745857_02529 [Andreprevotia lacus DSM 23236]